MNNDERPTITRKTSYFLPHKELKVGKLNIMNIDRNALTSVSTFLQKIV